MLFKNVQSNGGGKQLKIDRLYGDMYFEEKKNRIGERGNDWNTFCIRQYGSEKVTLDPKSKACEEGMSSLDIMNGNHVRV